MPSESIHQKLQRVRRPHVHIKYEVEVGDARKVLDLPFVMGVMGDFSGDSLGEMPPLRERKFDEINRDNFNTVMRSLRPSLSFRVDNKLGDGENQELPVNLKFESLDDFTPEGVARQVPELRNLLEMRERLNQLKVQIDNPKVEKELDKLIDALGNAEQREKFAREIAPSGDSQ